jgi:hypothetical protein
VASISRGEFADFTAQGGAPVIIRAATIRQLLAVPPKSGSNSVFRGVYVAGVTIVNSLDLADLTGPGSGALPPLVLHHCVLTEPVKINGTRLSRLDLVDCELVYLDGRNCVVEGTITLHHLQSSERDKLTGATARDDWAGPRGSHSSSSLTELRPQARCEINLRGARIDGNLDLCGCLLVAQPERPDFKPGDAPATYALNVGGARIGGRFEFSIGSAALGGISFNGATVGGSLWLAGAKLIAVESNAFDGQLMQVGGFVGMRAVKEAAGSLRFECEGNLNLLQATIKGALDLSGALLCAKKEVRSLGAYKAEIGDRLMMQASDGTGHRFESYGLIDLGNVSIGGQWICAGSDLRPAAASPARAAALTSTTTDPTTVLDATGALAKANVVFVNAQVFGEIVLSNATMEGNLTLGAPERDVLTIHASPEPREVLSLGGATMQKSLAVNGLSVVVSTGVDELHKLAKDGKVTNARSLALTWLPGCRLIEVLCQTPGGPAIVALLTGSRMSSLLYRKAPESIFPFMQKFTLELNNIDAAADYLRFFCSHIWADAGGFYLIEPGTRGCEALRPQLRERVVPLDVTSEGESFTATGSIQYGRSLFIAKLKITKSGKVEMLEDNETSRDVSEVARHDFPFKRPADNNQSGDPNAWFVEPGVPGAWADIAPEATIVSLRKALAMLPGSFRTRPVIDLAGATIGELQDGDGNSWPAAARLRLEGLTLSRIRSVDQSHALRRKLAAEVKARGYLRRLWWTYPTRTTALILVIIVLCLLLLPFFMAVMGVIWLGAQAMWLLSSAKRREILLAPTSIVWKARARWLLLQYERYAPTRSEFHPQPYEMLAKVYRQQGQFEDSRCITILKLDAYRKTKIPVIGRPFLWIYRLAFGYGLSIRRALVTFILSLGIGWAGVAWACHHGILVLNVTPDYLAEHAGSPPSCEGVISPPLYALDLFVPLVDLRQEELCAVRSTPLPASIYVHGTAWTSVTRQPYLQLLSTAVDDITGKLAALTRPLLNDLRFWKYAKAAYAFLGWIVSSLTILTITGVLKRQAEG